MRRAQVRLIEFFSQVVSMTVRILVTRELARKNERVEPTAVPSAQLCWAKLRELRVDASRLRLRRKADRFSALPCDIQIKYNAGWRGEERQYLKQNTETVVLQLTTHNSHP